MADLMEDLATQYMLKISVIFRLTDKPDVEEIDEAHGLADQLGVDATM
jgi:hypothetical protein